MARMRTVGVKLPEDAVKKIKTLAGRRGWSVSQYVRRMIEQSLAGVKFYGVDAFGKVESVRRLK